jgi:acyl-CoA synthetase (AMP-forming)/AMP-acid ligase II
VNPTLVGHLLAARAADLGEKAAIVEAGGAQVSFAEFAERVARRAGALAAAGIGPGRRVVLLVPVGIAMYEALLAVLQTGASVVLVDPQVGARGIEERLASVGVDGLIGSPKAHLLRLILPSLRGGRLYASTGWAFPPARRLSALDGPPLEPVAPAEGEPALITFTTGSTGAPKAMGRSHAFLLAQHAILASHMRLVPTDVDLPTLPVFLLNSLAAGATCVLPDGDLRDVSRLDPAKIAAQVRARGVTLSSGSPAFFETLTAHLSARGETLPLRRVFVGGARVPGRLLAALRATLPEAEIEVLYGSTEAEPIASIDADTWLADCAAREHEGACVGAPVHGLDLRVVDPDTGADRPSGEPGELWVSGAHVNRGYYRNPAADAENKVTDGARVWHRTGDAAWRDDAGRLWLVGRVSERVCGIYPFPAESRAERVPGVRRAALGVARGAPVLAFEGEADPGAVAAAAQVPRAVRVAAIPLDARHRAKVDRPALNALLA